MVRVHSEGEGEGEGEGELYNPAAANWRMIAYYLGRCLRNTPWNVSACLPVYKLKVTKLPDEGGLKVVASDNLCKVTFKPCTVYLIDVDRNCEDEHHETGLHSNVLVCDSIGDLHRFEPYYAQTVQDLFRLRRSRSSLPFYPTPGQSPL